MKIRHEIRRLREKFLARRGWKTRDKIVVIESDDWGMVRTSSAESLEVLREGGFKVDECCYTRYDALESDQCVNSLLDVLHEFKNKGEPIFTLNFVVANPDFEIIKQKRYKEYHYEPFWESYRKDNLSENVLAGIKEGILQGAFSPQLHAREHLNVRKWLRLLEKGDSDTLLLFGLKMYSAHRKGVSSCREELLDAFGGSQKEDSEFYNKVLLDAQDLFRKAFGQSSRSFIAPCYIWSPVLEHQLQKIDVRFLQGMYVQRVPTGIGGISRKLNYLGRKTKFGQVHLIRNVFFEPVQWKDRTEINTTFKEISNAFKNNQPAIICSHRVNYIGRIDSENRRRNLIALRELLEGIWSKWPDVQFMSSDQLGEKIVQESLCAE